MSARSGASLMVVQGLQANRAKLVIWTFVALIMSPMVGFFFSAFFGQAAGVTVTASLLVVTIAYFVAKLPLRRKDIANQIVQVSTVGRLPANTKSDQKTVGQLFVRTAQLRKFDIESYIQRKNNPHMLLVGISGTGKTTLLIHIILTVLAKTKICFSFKENDDYLRIGFPVLDVSLSLPDPFTDVDAFVTAFLIANPISSLGIQASYNPTMLRKMATKSTTWKQFMENVDSAEDEARKKRNSNEVASLSWIREKASQLTGPVHSRSMVEFIAQNPNIVLDFGRISNETARTFYSELVLRQIWGSKSKLAASQGQVIIAFDEAHRLIRKLRQEQEFKSILETYLREGRSAGFRVFASTQNYADIEPKVANNFYTQFIFHTGNQDDLSAFHAIEPMLSWTVADLPPAQFIDAKQLGIHDVIVGFQLAYPTRVDVETRYISVPAETLAEEPKLSVSVPEYRTAVMEMLARKPVYVHETARQLTKQYGLGIEDAKQLASRILRDIKKEEGSEIDSMPFDLRNREKEDGEGKVKAYLMYYKSDPYKNGNLSQLHTWQQNWVAVEYKKADYRIIDEAKLDDFNKRRPDLVVEKGGKQVSVEIETGLKNGNVQDLKERVEQSAKEGRETIIIVPNNDLRQIYSQVFPSSIVTCFFPFIRALQKEQPGQTATLAKVVEGGGVQVGEGGGNG